MVSTVSPTCRPDCAETAPGRIPNVRKTRTINMQKHISVFKPEAEFSLLCSLGLNIFTLLTLSAFSSEYVQIERPGDRCGYNGSRIELPVGYLIKCRENGRSIPDSHAEKERKAENTEMSVGRSGHRDYRIDEGNTGKSGCTDRRTGKLPFSVPDL